MSSTLSSNSNPLSQDDFALFRLERSFVVDLQDLEQRWKTLQRLSHPDKFTQESAAEQRIALQWSTRINEAYRRLRDPLTRAIYLAQLMGFDVKVQSQMPEDMLFQQMAWHEALNDSESLLALQDLKREVQAQMEDKNKACQSLFLNPAKDSGHALMQTIQAWMFMERFVQSVNAKLLKLSQGVQPLVN